MPGCAASSAFSLSRSASSVSDWELTETYSPVAIDIAPATSAATPATSTSLLPVEAAATPTRRLAVEIIPSFAPSTAALSHPMRDTLCRSVCLCFIFASFKTLTSPSRESHTKAAQRCETEIESQIVPCQRRPQLFVMLSPDSQIAVEMAEEDRYARTDACNLFWTRQSHERGHDQRIHRGVAGYWSEIAQA